MGINAAEVERVAAKAATTGGFAAVPLIQRYHPFVARARQLLAEGRFGTLSHIYFRLNRPTSARYPAWDAGWMLDPAETGGGCLRNLGPHGLDAFLYLTGEAEEVTGAQVSSRGLGQRVEDYASVLVRSAGGEETAPAQPAEPLARTALREALDHWRQGMAPPISVHDCLRAVRLIDRAYELAGRLRG